MRALRPLLWTGGAAVGVVAERALYGLRRLADGETVVDPTIVSRLLGRRAASIRWPSSPSASARCSPCWPAG